LWIDCIIHKLKQEFGFCNGNKKKYSKKFYPLSSVYTSSLEVFEERSSYRRNLRHIKGNGSFAWTHQAICVKTAKNTVSYQPVSLSRESDNNWNMVALYKRLIFKRIYFFKYLITLKKRLHNHCHEKMVLGFYYIFCLLVWVYQKCTQWQVNPNCFRPLTVIVV
jgi:hypothetical protein